MRKLLLAPCILSGISALGWAELRIPEGTKVRVRLEQTLSSATAEEGQPVQLSVTEEVRVGDTVVIAQGASVSGVIVQAVPKRRMGRTGKLDFSVERVIAADGASVPLRYTVTKKEGGSHGLRTGIIAGGAAVVFWPAAPVFLLMKGKDVTMNKGNVFDVFTDQSYLLRPSATTLSREEKAAQAPLAPESSGADSTVITITADSPGAEIEIDGAFVGSTPTTVHINPGNHRIVVKNGTESWQRDIQVRAGSSISLMAPFKKK